MTVVTRFAPSPTGYLHIGGARTALFNWLFARHHGGVFRLRVEDTDRERSTEHAKQAILDGLAWLGLDWDGETVFQSERAERHAALAHDLLSQGLAYRCFATPEELTEMRETARREGRSLRYDGRWRDRDPAEAPAGVAPVIRLKAPVDGETAIDDKVQGTVTVANAQLDDMVLLRADGTPTYMLSVVVDDHDMEITHVIRGDDHLTNSFRQVQLYRALGWEPPTFAHIPLIHGPDGAKLSKRHGALGIEAYRDMGFLPEAVRNYLLRLGWAHGDDEIIPTEQAIEWFTLDGVGKSPARFDTAKLTNVNGHYMREADDPRLVALVVPFLEDRIGIAIDETGRDRLLRGMSELKPRAKTLIELAEISAFYVLPRPLKIADKAAKSLDDAGRALVADLIPRLESVQDWSQASLETYLRGEADARGLGFGKVAGPVRAALTGAPASPGVFEVMNVLGREEALARLRDVIG